MSHDCASVSFPKELAAGPWDEYIFAFLLGHVCDAGIR